MLYNRNFTEMRTCRKKLFETRDQKIVEGHTGDKFWGGKSNALGNILMRVRRELQLAARSSTQTTSLPEVSEEVQAARKRTKGDAARNANFRDSCDKWMETDQGQGEDACIAQQSGYCEADVLCAHDVQACPETTDVEVEQTVAAQELEYDNTAALGALLKWLASEMTNLLPESDAEAMRIGLEVVLQGLIHVDAFSDEADEVFENVDLLLDGEVEQLRGLTAQLRNEWFTAVSFGSQ